MKTVSLSYVRTYIIGVNSDGDSKSPCPAVMALEIATDSSTGQPNRPMAKISPAFLKRLIDAVRYAAQMYKVELTENAKTLLPHQPITVLTPTIQASFECIRLKPHKIFLTFLGIICKIVAKCFSSRTLVHSSNENDSNLSRHRTLLL